MKLVIVMATLLMVAAPTLAQEEQHPGLSDQDLARLTLAISQEFDVMEARLQASLDERLATQQESLATLANNLAQLQADVDALRTTQTNHSELLATIEPGLNATQVAITQLEATQLDNARNQTARLQKDIRDARPDLSPLIQGIVNLAEQNEAQSHEIRTTNSQVKELQRNLVAAAVAAVVILVILRLRKAAPGFLHRLITNHRERRQERRLNQQHARDAFEAQLDEKREQANVEADRVETDFDIESFQIQRPAKEPDP